MINQQQNHRFTMEETVEIILALMSIGVGYLFSLVSTKLACSIATALTIFGIVVMFVVIAKQRPIDKLFLICWCIISTIFIILVVGAIRENFFSTIDEGKSGLDMSNSGGGGNKSQMGNMLYIENIEDEGVRAELKQKLEELAKDYPLGDGKQVNLNMEGIVIDVYTGPSDEYKRAADGKAAVGIREIFYCFGLEGEWYLIEYRTTKNVYRNGYILSNAIPETRQLNNHAIKFAHREAVLLEDAEVTDDPINDQQPLERLKKDTVVELLCFRKSKDNSQIWAFIEGKDKNKMPFRGYILIDHLMLIDEDVIIN